MLDKPIFVKVPTQAKTMESVRTFYENLLAVLEGYSTRSIVTKKSRWHKLSGCHEELHYHTTAQSDINIKISYLPNYFYFEKGGGYSGFSHLAKDERTYREWSVDSVVSNRFFEQKRKSILDGNLSKYRQPIRKAINLPERTVAVFTQVVDDTVAEFFKYEWSTFLLEICNILKAINVNVVIKRHPKCANLRVEETLLNLKDANLAIIMNESSIHDIIAAADAIVVANSGVGFEALFHEKPVFSFAKSDYQYATCKSNLLNFATDYDRYITDFSKKTQMIRDFVYFYLNNYLVENNKDSILSRVRELGLL